MSAGCLGRLTPPDFDHVAKYPLSALGADAPTDAPVVLGIDWYSNFDSPEEIDGVYWIGKGNLGSVRGGHCICAKPPSIEDLTAWWAYYNQGQTGHCVGFGNARAQSLLKRVEFNATWLYNAARNAEGNHSEEEGSTVRAAMRVLKNKGAKPKGATEPNPEDGVSAYRWATSWDEVRAALGVPDGEDGVALLQSWGEEYPHEVRLADEAGAKLLAEEGEAGIFTER